MNIQTVILPSPNNRDHVASYARIVNSCLQKFPYIYLSIRLPIYNPSAIQTSSQMGSTLSPDSSLTFISPPSEQSDTAPAGVSVNATWEMWDLIRSICDYNPRLTLSKDAIYLLLIIIFTSFSSRPLSSPTHHPWCSQQMECGIRTTHISPLIHFHSQHERLPSPLQTHTTIHPR